MENLDSESGYESYAIFKDDNVFDHVDFSFSQCRESCADISGDISVTIIMKIFES